MHRKKHNNLIDDAEDLDIVILMYNLIEYSRNYSKTDSLWNYYRDEPNNTTTDSESFKFKKNMIRKLILLYH